MKTTYTRTMFNPDFSKCLFRVYIHELPKWEAQDDGERIDYTGVKEYTIIEGGDEAYELEQGLGELIDELHEYLILHFEDGRTATFRNSHVELFIR